VGGHLAARVRTALVTAAATRAVAVRAGPVADHLPGGRERWERTNHRGETVTLLEGPAAAIGIAAGALQARHLPGRLRAAVAVAALGAGGFGALDDLSGSGADRGLRGHLAALRAGRVTTGVVKIAGLAGTGWVASRVAGHRGFDALLSGAVVAGTANLANLLDLRPGRSLKFALLHAPVLVIKSDAALVAFPVGAAAALLRDDLGERSMLGDTGANALGAALGLATVVSYGRLGRLAHLAGLVAATLASEKVSFTDVIARTPPLRVLDELGRRPTPAER
jgi:UDP-N-acetylmuramyl pentapeptide phosphotransferase/UDP-N-acetylglucosamine-1-phosphate transferase